MLLSQCGSPGFSFPFRIFIRHAGGREKTKQFYIKRLSRILPAYYIMLGIIIAVDFFTGTKVTVGEIAVNILCVQKFIDGVPYCGHLWYITCIMICYLITPLLCFCVKKIKMMRVWLQLFIYGMCSCIVLLVFFLSHYDTFYVYIAV